MMEIYEYDTPEIKELKQQINKAHTRQKQLSDKYKSVREYRSLQQDIFIMNLKIAQLEREEWEKEEREAEL